MKLISRKTASQILIFLLSAIVVFHLLVLVKIVPYSMVWGGKFDDYNGLLPF